jgi:hypothetical protein
MEKKFVKLSELVDQEITVKSIGLFKFVAWDNEAKKYITQNDWFKGATKKYPIEIEQGTVDIGANHVGAMFEGVQQNGQSDIIGATFKIKSNGKTDKDIRYFINAVRVKPAEPDYGDVSFNESGAPMQDY